MTEKEKSEQTPGLLSPVALLVPRPDHRLVRGQVGTVVETLSAATVLVEFDDSEGRAYAIEPCALNDLLVLHYVPAVF